MLSIYNNMSAGGFRKIAKYKDIEIEIEQVWHLRPTLTSVVVEALGTVQKGKQYLEQIPGFSSLTEIEKISLTSTACILKKAPPFSINSTLSLLHVFNNIY